MSKGMMPLFLLAAMSLGGAALAQAPAAPAAAPASGPPATPYGLAIGIDQAKQVAAAAVAKAKEVSAAPDSIAIVDPAGQLVYFERMDNASYGSGEVAIAKARSAALFRRPTKLFADLLAKGNFVPFALHGAVPLLGGLPLVSGGKIIGAIGAGGGTGAQDDQVAQAGAGALNK